MSTLRPIVILALAGLLAPACKDAPAPAPEPTSNPALEPCPGTYVESAQPASAGAPAELNESFLQPDLDPAEFVARFERESREIAAYRDRIAATLELAPGERVADIGAGTGLFLGPFVEAVGADGKVFAVDISPGLIAYIQERAREERWSTVETVLCSERSADLAPASVDAVFVCDTYHHFTHPADTLASLHAALRPGGRLYVVDFERIPGVSREWLLDHVRAGKEVFRAEIEGAGFRFVEELPVEGLEENYLLRFERP